MVRKVADM